ncbi:MAG: nuclear transport factor 2 family protein [Dehalococcoidia bacterium]
MNTITTRTVAAEQLRRYLAAVPGAPSWDSFMEIWAPDVRWEMPASPGAPGRRGSDREGLEQEVLGVFQLFRDQGMVAFEELVDGDRVAVRSRWWATVNVDLPGMPAGTKVWNDFVDFFTVRDGRIARYTAVGGPILVGTPPSGGINK